MSRRSLGAVMAVLASLVLAGPAAAATEQSGRSGLDAYKITTDGAGLRTLAAEGFDMTESGRRGRTVEIVATAEQVEQLRKLGLDPELKRNQAGLSARQFDAADQRPDGSYDVWRPFFDDTYVGDDEEGNERETLYEEMQRIAAENTDIVKPVQFGQSINGKPLLALKVTKDARLRPDGQRPAVLYLSTQHAREWIVTEMARRLTHKVIDDYRAGDEQMRRLVTTRELWFVWVANPDGYDFTFTPGNRLWRKNLREVNGEPGIQSGDGVDPNRNFPTNWGYDNEGSSPDPSSETYRGSGPASEPETQGLDRLLRRVGFEMFINYHSAAELLLYPLGWQVETPAADDPIYRALSGTDDDPAIKGVEPGAPDDYDPDLSAELYTTNGETTDHAYSRYDVLSWTPEMDVADPERGAVGEDGGPPSVFEFQDREDDMQQAFEKNVPFALDVAESADDPDDPESHLGNVAEDFEIEPFAHSYGDPQTVQVTAKRELGPVTVHWRVNGGAEQSAATSEWQGGERFGDVGDVYYHRVRGTVTGTSPGDSVRVWFTAGGKRSQSFTYDAVGESANRVLILANEDYTGPVNSPAYPGTAGPYFVDYYRAALQANGVGADVYDVDARGRTAPDALGVLSHYDAVVWYTGNDLLTRSPGQPGQTGVARLADDMILAVRAYLNEGGKLLYTGQRAGTAQVTSQPFNPAGEPPYCKQTAASTGTVLNCVPLSDDFLQYYLGAYLHVDAAGDFATDDIPAASQLQLQLAGDPFGSTAFALNGGDSANNQGHVYSMVTTSSILPPEQFPQFGSSRAVTTPGGGAFDPVTGEWYMTARSDDAAYQRLRRTIDLTGATSGELNFELSHDTEADYDFVFVEAHTVGQDDWTTLPDANGNTSDDVGDACDIDWNTLHPWLDRYQTNGPGEADCTSTGTTGEWHAASGNSGGYDDWSIDLSAYAGKQVEVSITYAQDFAVAGLGVFLDDVQVVKNGAAAESTSFEDGLGGFTAGPQPEGTQKATTWERSQRGDFQEGPGVATEDSLYFGFGLEGVRTAAQRNALMGNAMRYLGVLGGGGGQPGGGGGGGQPGGGGGGQPGGGDDDGARPKGPRVRVIGRRVRVTRSGRAPVRLRCPRSAEGACRGTLKLRKGGETIARRDYRIAAGKRKTVRLRLDRNAQRRLARRGTLRATLRMTARDRESRVRRSTVRITLRAPAPRD